MAGGSEEIQLYKVYKASSTSISMERKSLDKVIMRHEMTFKIPCIMKRSSSYLSISCILGNVSTVLT